MAKSFLSLKDILHTRDNDHRAEVTAFEECRRLRWHAPTPPDIVRSAISVVIPAWNAAYSLPTVLDALARSAIHADVKVIVVDDGSQDDTATLAAAHPVVDQVARLPRRAGGGMARNVGTQLAQGETILHLDADMVVPEHALADISARADDSRVLVGFRHEIAYEPLPDGRVRLPAGEPDLGKDDRVRCDVRAGEPTYWSGQIYRESFVCRVLDDTQDFIGLGNGTSYHGWRLTNMVSPDLLAVPRRVMVEVGGFDPRFTVGWGFEDTHFAALLIAADCKIIPLRQVRAFHVDPPDASDATCWKKSTVRERRTLYQRLLDESIPADRAAAFNRVTAELLTTTELMK